MLAGAAWSVPAIAIATATPAHAASGAQLAFAQSSYSGKGCSRISGVKVTVTDNGSPKAGTSVTVSLSNGWTFSSGAATNTSTTDSNGVAGFLNIDVPAGGGSATASATASGMPSTSASLSGTATTSGVVLDSGSLSHTTTVPAGSTPVAGSLYLTSDARLVDASTGAVCAVNVEAWGQMWRISDTQYRIGLRKKDGTATYVENGTESTAVGVPSGSTPIFSSRFLAQDGRLIDGGQNGKSYSPTNVELFSQTIPLNGTSGWLTSFRNKDGSFVYLETGSVRWPTGVPAGSTPAVGSLYLTPDGRLVDGSDGSVIATGVNAIGRVWRANASTPWLVPLKKSDGSTTYLSNGTEKTTSGVPNGSTPVAGSKFLSPAGRLIDGGVVDGVAGKVYDPSDIEAFGEAYVMDAQGNWRLPVRRKDSALNYLETGAVYSPAAIPEGATPIGGSLFLTTDGRVVDGSTGAQYASDVASFGQLYRNISSNTWRLPLKKKDKSASYLDTGTETAATGVPADSTPVASAIFLSPAGRLINGGDGKTYAITDVASFGAIFQPDNSGEWQLPVKKTDGSVAYVRTRNEMAVIGVPSGSTPVASSLFLASDGRLIDGSSGSVLASGVDTYGQVFRDISTGSWRLPLKKKNGDASYLQDGAETATSGVSSGSSPAGGSMFLTSDGRIIDGSNGSVRASGVSTFGQIFSTDNNGNWAMALMAQTC